MRKRRPSSAAGDVLSTMRLHPARDARHGAYEVPPVPVCRSGVDGGGLREIFRPPAGIAWGVSVAREAGSAVVAVGSTFGSSDTGVDVWSFRLDGSLARDLTADVPANDALTSVSADGRRIAFRSGRDGLRGETSEPPTDMAVYVLEEGDEQARADPPGSRNARRAAP